MYHDNIEFHNTAELRETADSAGLRLQRVPEEVRVYLSERGKTRMLSPACGEIRFVSEGDRVRITLSASEGGAQVIPFWGLFQGKERYVIGEDPVTVELTYPERLQNMKPRAMSFSQKVWRLVTYGDVLYYHGIEGAGLRPPNEDELPEFRYLAYGTSITHGSAATGPHLTYVSQTARRLGADLINLGSGGTCFCEPEIADYIASRKDWDIASLALSVNMIGAGFALSEFRDRTRYLVERVAGSNGSRPVAAITIYPYFGDDAVMGPLSEWKGTPGEYRQVLRDVVSEAGLPNLHLIEGEEIMDDITGLTCDLLHPADNGMIGMGKNLADHLGGLLAEGGKKPQD